MTRTMICETFFLDALDAENSEEFLFETLGWKVNVPGEVCQGSFCIEVDEYPVVVKDLIKAVGSKARFQVCSITKHGAKFYEVLGPPKDISTQPVLRHGDGFFFIPMHRIRAIHTFTPEDQK